MGEKMFQGERNYQAALVLAKNMLKAGIITPADYAIIAAHFQKKFRPLFDTRLPVKTLPL